LPQVGRLPLPMGLMLLENYVAVFAHPL